MMDVSIRTKSYAVIILMLSCFALLYPKILHPMLLHIVGLRTVDPMQDDFIHPRDRHIAVKSNAAKPPHPGHHPGRVVSHQTQSGRGGVMTMILPVYAIGIVFYLLYTLVKVFGGSKDNKKKMKRESLLKNYYRDFHYDPNAGDFKMHYNKDGRDGPFVDDTPEDISYRYRPTDDIYNSARNLPHDLENLLQKVDERNINETEMHQLKVRLEETETQLTKILMAMERLEGKNVDDDVGEDNIESTEISTEDDVQESFQDCEENPDECKINSNVIHRRQPKAEVAD